MEHTGNENISLQNKWSSTALDQVQVLISCLMIFVGGSLQLADREVAEDRAMGTLEVSLRGGPEATVPPR